MRVMFINPLLQKSAWEDDINTKWPPLGVGYIAAYLEREGHAVGILERRRIIKEKPRTETFMEELDQETLRRVEEFKPDMIGFTGTTFHITDAYRTAELVSRISPRPSIIFGGSHVTAVPERTLEECKAADLVAVGEGEELMAELCAGTPAEQINGLFYRSDGTIKNTGVRPVVADIDSLPYPALHLMDTEFYFRPSSQLFRGYYLSGTTMFTARGCPYRCAFCQSHQLSQSNTGRFIRLRKAENVGDEILHVEKTYKAEGFYFTDDLFTVNAKRVLEICNLMIERGMHKRIKWCCNIRVDVMDEALLHKMKEAGCVKLLFGIESGSDRMLKILKKGGKVSAALNLASLKVAKKVGISSETGIILGIPGEREEDFLLTAKLLKKARPDRINRGKLYPIPGTHFYDQLVQEGKLDPTIPWEEIQDRYVLSSRTFADIPEERFKKLLVKLDRGVTLPINYMFMVRNNWRSYPKVAIRQFLLLIAHCTVLYLPVPLQRTIRKLASKLRLKSKYVFE